MTVKLSENPNIPVVPDWITLTEAAERLGITRQSVYTKAKNMEFKSIHRLGENISVVLISEIEELVAKRKNKLT